jgi:hypothetical protein
MDKFSETALALVMAASFLLLAGGVMLSLARQNEAAGS